MSTNDYFWNTAKNLEASKKITGPDIKKIPWNIFDVKNGNLIRVGYYRQQQNTVCAWIHWARITKPGRGEVKKQQIRQGVDWDTFKKKLYDGHWETSVLKNNWPLPALSVITEDVSSVDTSTINDEQILRKNSRVCPFLKSRIGYFGASKVDVTISSQVTIPARTIFHLTYSQNEDKAFAVFCKPWHKHRWYDVTRQNSAFSDKEVVRAARRAFKTHSKDIGIPFEGKWLDSDNDKNVGKNWKLATPAKKRIRVDQEETIETQIVIQPATTTNIRRVSNAFGSGGGSSGGLHMNSKNRMNNYSNNNINTTHQTLLNDNASMISLCSSQSSQNNTYIPSNYNSVHGTADCVGNCGKSTQHSCHNCKKYKCNECNGWDNLESYQTTKICHDCFVRNNMNGIRDTNNNNNTNAMNVNIRHGRLNVIPNGNNGTFIDHSNNNNNNGNNNTISNNNNNNTNINNNRNNMNASITSNNNNNMNNMNAITSNNNNNSGSSSNMSSVNIPISNNTSLNNNNNTNVNNNHNNTNTSSNNNNNGRSSDNNNNHVSLTNDDKDRLFGNWNETKRAIALKKCREINIYQYGENFRYTHYKLIVSQLIVSDPNYFLYLTTDKLRKEFVKQVSLVLRKMKNNKTDELNHQSQKDLVPYCKKLGLLYQVTRAKANLTPKEAAENRIRCEKENMDVANNFVNAVKIKKAKEAKQTQIRNEYYVSGTMRNKQWAEASGIKIINNVSNKKGLINNKLRLYMPVNGYPDIECNMNRKDFISEIRKIYSTTHPLFNAACAMLEEITTAEELNAKQYIRIQRHNNDQQMEEDNNERNNRGNNEINVLEIVKENVDCIWDIMKKHSGDKIGDVENKENSANSIALDVNVNENEMKTDNNLNIENSDNLSGQNSQVPTNAMQLDRNVNEMQNDNTGNFGAQNNNAPDVNNIQIRSPQVNQVVRDDLQSQNNMQMTNTIIQNNMDLMGGSENGSMDENGSMGGNENCIIQ